MPEKLTPEHVAQTMIAKLRWYVTRAEEITAHMGLKDFEECDNEDRKSLKHIAENSASDFRRLIMETEKFTPRYRGPAFDVEETKYLARPTSDTPSCPVCAEEELKRKVSEALRKMAVKKREERKAKKGKKT